MGKISGVFALGAVLLGPVVLAAEQPSQEVLDRARRLLEQRRAEQAYQLLAPHEYDWAGNPEYDALFGRAAVATGRPDEGAMALERAVDADPGDTAARTDLARAYQGRGDAALARREMDALGIRSLTRERYIDAEREYAAAPAQPGPQQTWFRYFVMLDAGYDSNVSASTDDDTFLGLPLDDRNVEKDSGYASISNGGYLELPISSTWSYGLSFNLIQRRYFSATFANSDRAGLYNSFLWRTNATEMNFGAGVYTAYLDSRFPYDGEHSQSGANLDYSARWFLGDSRWQIGPDVVFAAIRHPSETRIFDVDQLLHGVTLNYLGLGTLPSFGFALWSGEAQARQSGSPYGRDLYGARFSSSWSVGPPGRMYAYTGMTRSNYEGEFFGEQRDDTQYSAGLSAVLRIFSSPNWALIPHLAYIVNHSDVDLFEYDRTEIGLAFRWISD